MAIKIFHLHLPAADFHGYYTTLSALYNDQGPAIGKSLSTLQKYDFTQPWIGDHAVIRKECVQNSKEIFLARKKK